MTESLKIQSINLDDFKHNIGGAVINFVCVKMWLLDEIKINHVILQLKNTHHSW